MKRRIFALVLLAAASLPVVANDPHYLHVFWNTGAVPDQLDGVLITVNAGGWNAADPTKQDNNNQQTSCDYGSTWHALYFEDNANNHWNNGAIIPTQYVTGKDGATWKVWSALATGTTIHQGAHIQITFQYQRQ